VSQIESKFQTSFIRKLKELFPGCLVIKNDPNYLQGVPDLLLLWRDKWAAFECKARTKARTQPNQEYYVLLMNAMSFAAFVAPETEKVVLDELQAAFGSDRSSCVFKR
jgi:hypothetical protein